MPANWGADYRFDAFFALKGQYTSYRGFIPNKGEISSQQQVCSGRPVRNPFNLRTKINIFCFVRCTPHGPNFASMESHLSLNQHDI